MADGGAGSEDAFRIPTAGEELTYPFSQFVVRYGHTTRLEKSTAAIAGVTADLSPPMEEPYRLIYFVVTDQMRTTIAVLRAVLKEGLEAPLRLPKALVIDELHTLEVFRKQGLATSLTNFVKGIAEAHGIGLYACCGVFTRSFWEVRGFEEETSFEMQRACGYVADMIGGGATVLLRAGSGYTEYQPADGDRLSITRPFHHGQGGDVCMGPLSDSRFLGQEPSPGGGVLTGDVVGVGDGRLLNKESLPPHDKPTSEVVSTASDSSVSAAAGEGSALEQRGAAGGWPGESSASGLSPMSSSVGVDGTERPAVAGYFGWEPAEQQIGAGILGPVTGAPTPSVDRRAEAARALLAIPSSGGHGGSDVVDLTGGIGGSLAEDEEQMQLAIAMSLSAAEAAVDQHSGSSIVVENSRSKPAARGVGEVSGDDTDTEEDVGFGAKPSSPDAGTARSGSPDSSGDAREISSISSGNVSDCGDKFRDERASGRSFPETVFCKNGHGRDESGDSRRIRRRRCQGGATTLIEQSPGDAGVTAEGRVDMEVDAGGAVPPPLSALAPLNESVHANISGFRGAGEGYVSDPRLVASLGRNSKGGSSTFGEHQSENCSSMSLSPARRTNAENASGAEGSPSTRLETGSLGAATAYTGSPRSSPSRSSVGPPVTQCPPPSSPPPYSVEPYVSNPSLSAETQVVGAASAVLSPAVAAAVGVLGLELGTPNSGVKILPKDQRPVTAGIDDNLTRASIREQHREKQQQLSVESGGSGMNGAWSSADGNHRLPDSATEAAGVGAGGGGYLDSGIGGGGGLTSDDVGANEFMLRDFGVGHGALDGGGGRLDDRLITVAGWEGDDNDEELQLAMEASRRCHEEEMLQRATQESQQDAAAAVTAAAAAAAADEPVAAQRLSLGGQASSRSPSSSASALAYASQLSVSGSAAASGGGPDVAILPPSFGGYRAPPQNVANSDAINHVVGTAHPGTGGGTDANGLETGAGAGGGTAVSSGSAAWMGGGWDDQEVVPFVGKGKGRCRD